MSKEAMGRLILEASAGMHGGVAKQIADAWALMATECEMLQEAARVRHWMPIQGTPLAIRMHVLDETTAWKNHGQALAELASRGGMSPVEAVALAKKLPLSYVRSLQPASETERNRKAIVTLSEHGVAGKEATP